VTDFQNYCFIPAFILRHWTKTWNTVRAEFWLRQLPKWSRNTRHDHNFPSF